MRSLSVVMLFLAVGISAYGSPLVIDNFSCPDGLSTTGPVFAQSFVSCAGSIGGLREDAIFFTGGSGSNASSLSSNPPAGAITGTIGSGLDGTDILAWGINGGAFDLPNLNLTGDSILVEIKSNSAGTLDVTLGSGSAASSNVLSYSAAFAASSSYEDVLIPLINPTVLGTGAEVSDVTAIGLMIGVPAGGNWTIDNVEAVPEPSGLLLTGLCLLGVGWKMWRERASRMRANYS